MTLRYRPAPRRLFRVGYLEELVQIFYAQVQLWAGLVDLRLQRRDVSFQELDRIETGVVEHQKLQPSQVPGLHAACSLPRPRVSIPRWKSMRSGCTALISPTTSEAVENGEPKPFLLRRLAAHGQIVEDILRQDFMLRRECSSSFAPSAHSYCFSTTCASPGGCCSTFLEPELKSLHAGHASDGELDCGEGYEGDGAVADLVEDEGRAIAILKAGGVDAPRRRHAGTAGRCCRPSSAAETGRVADTATDSRCAGERRPRSSPRACPSCAAARRTSPPGSAAPDVPIARRSNRWEGRPRLLAGRPMRLRPHPKSTPPSHLGGGESRAARSRHNPLRQALRQKLRSLTAYKNDDDGSREA